MELLEGKMQQTLSCGNVSTKLQRIAQLAREHPERSFTAISHVIDIELLKEAYHRTRKDGAVGVDGQDAEQYATQLETNLMSLLNRFKDGSYRAPPVKRVYIPKGGGRGLRPIGIPTFEDKILQRSVSMVLEAIYEQDFLCCSYGFRPKRSAHQALEALWKTLMDNNGGWVVEVDLKDYFGSLSHNQLRSFLDRRVKDGVIRRVIDKWLKAGVMEEGSIRLPETGTPQGGVVSPILSNVYLHEVLDVWFERQVRPMLIGRGALIRYADDFVMVFEQERDAKRMMEALPKRCGKYGLTIHPDKTRMLRFERPSPKQDDNDGEGPGSFDFLGITHFWGRTRKGRWAVRQKTASSRFTRAVLKIHTWCRSSRHKPVAEQQQTLNRKLQGHYNYYGIIGNGDALHQFFEAVRSTWRKWLNRRGARRPMDCERFELLLGRYPLLRPRVVHGLGHP
jgi:group II intron reverse transcriptase/maturase